MATFAPQGVPSTIVAIPAKNEAGRIAACLLALDRQSQRPGAVLLLVNGATDNTEAIARSMRPGLGYDLRIVIRSLPPALRGAGHARRLAMDLAAQSARPDDILLTTDADSVPAANWIAGNVAAIANGADAVCGRAILDPTEAALMPPHIHAGLALEQRLRGLLDRIAWLHDPEPHDPPPRHTEASGASIAVTTAMFHKAGGIPALSSGEDRAFLTALWRIDARLRHDPSVRVTVSARLDGRAIGGMAETLARRCRRQDALADTFLEPALDAARRYALRGRTRFAWQARRPDAALANALAIGVPALAGILASPAFGTAWAILETISPILARRRIPFTRLPAEIAEAESLLLQDAAPPGEMAAA